MERKELISYCIMVDTIINYYRNGLHFCNLTSCGECFQCGGNHCKNAGLVWNCWSISLTCGSKFVGILLQKNLRPSLYESIRREQESH